MATIVGGATGSTLTGTNAGDIALVSINAAGVLENSDADYEVALSADGTKVVFFSTATNLTSGGGNGGNFGLFIKDLTTGVVTQVNPAGSVTPGFGVALAADNSGIAFAYSVGSTETLAYLNLNTHVLTTIATNAYESSLTPDGSHLAYVSGSGAMQTVLVPVAGGTPTVISSNSSGTTSNGFSNPSAPPTFSADGNLVTFDSTGSNLVNGVSGDHLYVKNLTTGAVTEVDATGSGTAANGSSYGAVISADGTKVLFSSTATNLVSGVTSGAYEAYLKNLTTGAVTLVSADASGVAANNAGQNGSSDGVFSADGTKVYFDSDSTNLVSGDTNGQADIFVKTLATGAISIVSTSAAGAQGNNSAFNPAVSADGNELAFKSNSTNLVSGDTNGAQDIFVKQITGNDTITGGIGNDTINGLGGANTLTGGSGADIFVHAAGSSTDTITDFSHAQGDTIQLTGFSFHTLGDILAVSAQSGSNTVITLGSGSLTLNNVTKTNLTAQDFVLTPLTVTSGQTFTTTTFLGGTDAVNVAAGGVITLGTAAIDLVWNGNTTGGGVTITNAGTISQTGTGANGRAAIATGGATPTGILTINNTGTISSVAFAMNFSGVPSGGQEIVTNSGTISSSVSNVAILFGAGDDTLNLISGETITGKVDGGAGNNTLNLSGAGGGTIRGNTEVDGSSNITFAGYNNFNTVNVNSGTWTLYGGGYYDTLNIAANAVFVVDELNAAANGNPSDGGIGALNSTLHIANSGTLRSLASSAVRIYYIAGVPVDSTSPSSPIYYTGTGKIETGGFYSVAPNVSLTVSGGVTVIGGTTLILGVLNAAVTVNSGTTLQIGYGGAQILNEFDSTMYQDTGHTGQVNGAIVDNGTLTIARTDNYTISSALTGFGSLVKNGPGILTLGSLTNFAGTATLNAGEIDLSGQMLTTSLTGIIAGSGVSGPLTVNNSGSITALAAINLFPAGVSTTETVTNSGTLHGTGAFAVIMGQGTDTFNAVTGSSTIGRVLAGSGNGTINLSGSGTGTIYGSTENINSNTQRGTFNGWDGFSTVNVNSGTWTLEGGGYYNNLTIASGATFIIHANLPAHATATPNGTPGDDGIGPLGATSNPLGSTTLTLVNNGALELTGDDNFFGYDPNSPLALSYSGTGQVIWAGTGANYINPNQTYAVAGGSTVSSGTVFVLGSLTGGVSIGSGGVVQIGGGGTLVSQSGYHDTGATGSVGGAIVDNGVLRIARSDSFTLTNALSGTGALQASGPGALTLPGSTNFGGNVLADGGTLNLAGTIATTKASTAAVGSSGGSSASAVTIAVASGSVVSSVSGAAVDMSTAGYAVALNNSGTLSGDTSLNPSVRVAVMFNSFNDTFTNTGTVNGIVSLGNGNSTLTSSGGTINGVVALGSGSDTVTLGAENNTVTLAAGTHVVDAGGGTNTVSYASAASGVSVNMALQGQAQFTGIGTDTLTHFQSLIGSGFHDLLTVGDATTVRGLGGADTFRIASTSAHGTVADFTDAQGDKIDLSNLHLFHTFADVQAALSTSGSDTVLTVGAGTLTLTGVQMSSLTAQDFILTTSTSDFSQTGSDALLFRNASSGDWGFMQASPGGGEAWHPIGPSSADYTALGRGDFNGDGTLDTAFRQITGNWGFLTISPTGGETWHQAGNASLAYDAVATGDILGSGSADVVFRNASSGDWGFMSSTGAGDQTWHPIGPTGAGYSVVGYGDFDGDGVFDVAFRNGSTGDWGFMSVLPTGGETWHPVGNASTAYAAVGSADFLGTRQTEIAFRNNASGDFGFMQANNSGGETWHPIGSTGTAYVAIGNGDYNGDGVQDVAFRNVSTGDWGYMTVNPTGGETWHGVGNASLAYGTI